MIKAPISKDVDLANIAYTRYKEGAAARIESHAIRTGNPYEFYEGRVIGDRAIQAVGYWSSLIGTAIAVDGAKNISSGSTAAMAGAAAGPHGAPVVVAGGTAVAVGQVEVLAGSSAAAVSAAIAKAAGNQLGGDLRGKDAHGYQDLVGCEEATEAGKTMGDGIKFGSDTKSQVKLNNQMNKRGWTEQSVRATVDSPYTTRVSTNKATGNPATVYYTERGSYVIVDDITKEVVQVSDNINPSTWVPDSSIVNPYIPSQR